MEVIDKERMEGEVTYEPCGKCKRRPLRKNKDVDCRIRVYLSTYGYYKGH
jgi:hypothetical protein